MSESIQKKVIPKVSVFMAVYQQKDFICEALDSVLMQNYPNMEVVIGDDGSTDGTQEILKQYELKYPKLIRLILAKENTGITANCNRILKECTGQYIAFMAGDDIWLHGKIQTQVDYLESHPRCSICYHNLDVFDSDSGKTLRYFNGPEANFPHEGTVEVAVKYGTFNGAISNMVRRSDCPPHGFDSSVSMASDWLFWVDILLNGGEIHYLKKVLARYRRHGNNITQLTQLRNYREHLQSANIVLKKKPKMIREILYRKANIYNMLKHLDGNTYRRILWSIYHKANLSSYAVLYFCSSIATTVSVGTAIGHTNGKFNKKLSSDDKAKIVFFIADLSGGGAERVLVNVLKGIDRNHFVPILFLFKKYGVLLSSLPEDIEIYSQKELKGKFWHGFQWLNLLIQFVRHLKKIKPVVVFSFMWYPNAVAIAAKILGRLHCKVIVSERTSTFIYSSRLENFLRNFIIKFLYPRANLIISPSRKIAQDIILQTVPESKVRVIHNPVDISEISMHAKEEIEHQWYRKKESIVIAIGRLGNEKGFDYLIKAIALLAGEGIQCKLIILGEGKEKENLLRLVEKLGLNDRVSFEGFQENPYKYLARSTVFVLSSLYEGFPNVLLEAMALGIPSVATRCPTGPDEIITEGVDGILVPPADEKAIADAIKKLLLDEDLRKRLSEAGKRRIQDFAIEKIVKQYEDAIESVCAVSAER